MSAEKLSPRQQMIGIMYLVLLAMLAMNASKDLLNAFVALEHGIGQTNKNFAAKNFKAYGVIEKAAGKFEAAKKINVEAQKVKAQADKLFNIIEEDIVKTLLNPESMVEETFTTPAGVYGRPSFWDESYPELTHEEIINLLSTEAWSEPLTEA